MAPISAAGDGQEPGADGDERDEGEIPWRIAGYPLLMLPHGAGKGQWRWLLRCPAVNLEQGTGRLNEMACRAALSSTCR